MAMTSGRNTCIMYIEPVHELLISNKLNDSYGVKMRTF